MIPINKADIGDAVLALTVDDITEYYNVEISEDNLSELKNNGFSFKYVSVNIDANEDIDLPDDKVDDTDIPDITTQSAITT